MEASRHQMAGHQIYNGWPHPSMVGDPSVHPAAAAQHARRAAQQQQQAQQQAQQQQQLQAMLQAQQQQQHHMGAPRSMYSGMSHHPAQHPAIAGYHQGRYSPAARHHLAEHYDQRRRQQAFPAMMNPTPWGMDPAAAAREEWAAAAARAQHAAVAPGLYQANQAALAQQNYADYWRRNSTPGMHMPMAYMQQQQQQQQQARLQQAARRPDSSSIMALQQQQLQQQQKRQLAPAPVLKREPPAAASSSSSLQRGVHNNNNPVSLVAPVGNSAAETATTAKEAAANLLRVREVVSTVAATFGAFEKASAVDDDNDDIDDDMDDDDDVEEDDVEEDDEEDYAEDDEADDDKVDDLGRPLEKVSENGLENKRPEKRAKIEASSSSVTAATRTKKETTALGGPLEKSDPQVEAHDDSPSASGCDATFDSAAAPHEEQDLDGGDKEKKTKAASDAKADSGLEKRQDQLEAIFEAAMQVTETKDEDATTAGASAFLEAWIRRQRPTTTTDDDDDEGEITSHHSDEKNSRLADRRVLLFLADVAINHKARPLLLKRVLECLGLDASGELVNAEFITAAALEGRRKANAVVFKNTDLAKSCHFPSWQHVLDTHACPVLYMSSTCGRLVECDANDVFKANFFDTVQDDDGVFDIFEHVVDPQDLPAVSAALAGLFEKGSTYYTTGAESETPPRQEACVVATFNVNANRAAGWMAKRHTNNAQVLLFIIVIDVSSLGQTPLRHERRRHRRALRHLRHSRDLRPHELPPQEGLVSQRTPTRTQQTTLLLWSRIITKASSSWTCL